jgi:hypothetical protein
MAPIHEASRLYGGAAAIPPPRGAAANVADDKQHRVPVPTASAEAPRAPPDASRDAAPSLASIESSRGNALTATPDAADTDASYLAQARRLLVDVVPSHSTKAYLKVARILSTAARPTSPPQQAAVLALANGVSDAAETMRLDVDVSPADARRLHAQARHAYGTRRHLRDAFEFALKAFGANPNDAEIAGHLAFLHLKLAPVHAERARQLALHAIALRTDRYPAPRPEDWTTFAVASALAARQIDARHALYASLVLARDVDRLCYSALGAYAAFGERLRDPVEAMLNRLHVEGRLDDSPNCASSTSRIAQLRPQ